MLRMTGRIWVPSMLNVARHPPMAFEQGTTVTLAYPVKGVRGLDLVVNTFGGHRLTSTGSHIASAAVTAGLRLKW
ncbi:hypothetical protein AD933_14345 [Acetobacter malorum]|uniref:Uncharacterized protein n=1 Tax=Acetobacter malorum TaxID=178901 RepID=A0A149RIE4_9PROT|nr:hypothetical protein AD933_14345 [Acetobacter malorum]